MCLLVTDKREREMLLRTFSESINRKCLERFAQHNGYDNDFIRILFKNNLDEYEDQKEIQEMADNQVVLFAEYPAAPVDEKLYLTFEELYNYIKDVVQKNYINDVEMHVLLSKVKSALAI